MFPAPSPAPQGGGVFNPSPSPKHPVAPSLNSVPSPAPQDGAFSPSSSGTLTNTPSSVGLPPSGQPAVAPSPKDPVAPSSSVPGMFPAPSPVPQGGGVFNPSPSPVLIQNGSAENVTQKPFAYSPSADGSINVYNTSGSASDGDLNDAVAAEGASQNNVGLAVTIGGSFLLVFLFCLLIKRRCGGSSQSGGSRVRKGRRPKKDNYLNLGRKIGTNKRPHVVVYPLGPEETSKEADEVDGLGLGHVELSIIDPKNVTFGA